MAISIFHSLACCKPEKMVDRVKEFLDAKQCSPETMRAALEQLTPSEHVANAMELVKEEVAAS